MDPSEMASLQDRSDKKSDSKNDLGKPRRRKSKKDRIVESCGDNFMEYSGCTSIHGIQYLGANKKTVLERLWWFVMIVVSFTLCCFFIRKVWIKWTETPVIVTFAEVSTPIWQIPFPAITICSRNRLPQSKYNYTEKLELLANTSWTDLTEEQRKEFRLIAQVCHAIKVTQDEEFTDEETVGRLKYLTKPLRELFRCSWKRNTTDCNDVFNPVTSDKGFCYTFNGLDPTEIFRENAVQYSEYNISNRYTSKGWTLDDGYPLDTSPDETFPRRISSPSVTAAFQMSILTAMDELSYDCAGTDQGYRVSLQSPSDYPRMSQDYFMAPLKQMLFVAIKPKMITTSPELINYDPDRRKCYMPGEKKLMYFKTYSLTNCEWECLSNHTFQICGCVEYWMPRERWMPICSVSKLKCTQTARYNVEQVDMRYTYAKSTGNEAELEKLKTMRGNCNCMHSCTLLTYEAEVTQNYQEKESIMKKFNISREAAKTVSLINMRFFFKEAEIITSRRSELYGISDFLSNCGGILGLFMGFSLLSLVEIIYFSIIRPTCALRETTKDT